MGISSYVVFAEPGKGDAVRRALAAIPGCEAAEGPTRDLVLVVAEGAGSVGDEVLRGLVESTAGVQAVSLAFAEIGLP